MRVIQIGQGDDLRSWDSYVEPLATAITDLSTWRSVIKNAYGLQSYFLAALDEGGRQVGALALYLADHLVFGRYLATAPFGNDGGFFFESPEARDSLAQAARQLADRLDVDYLVIRSRNHQLSGFAVDQRFATAVLDLQGGADAVWRERLKGKTRNQIRKGMKEGFSVTCGLDQAEAFYRVFHAHMRDLGSPAHGLRFYESIARLLGDRADFLVVRDGDEPAAGALLFRVNETAMNYHTVALRQYNRRCPNYLIYWTMIEQSCQRGCRWFDMGRSEKESSVLDFKMNWNPKVVPLNYNYYLRKLKKAPYLAPGNSKYRLAIAAWRRLPLFLTRSLGPRLISGLL